MSAKVTIECSSCGMRIRVPQTARAALCRCPRCGVPFEEAAPGGENTPRAPQQAVPSETAPPEPALTPGVPVAPPVLEQDADVGAGRYCHGCGRRIHSSASTCPHCGADQRYGALPSDGPSRVAAALLAIFLGYLGAHKFYLGQPGLGTVYLILGTVLGCVTFGITSLLIGIISLVEGLVYLSYSDREFALRYGRF